MPPEPPKFKRPGMTMPGNVPGNGGGATNGNNDAVTGVTPTGGGASGAGGGGAGCEKYICNCNELDGPIGEYNDAVDALGQQMQATGISNKLNQSLTALNNALVKITSSDPSKKPPKDGDQCGCPEGMIAIIKGKLGPHADGVYNSCCMAGGADDPWGTEPGMVSPCGKAKDAAVKNGVRLLFSCPPIEIKDGITNGIIIAKIKCVKDTSKQCTEAGRTIITPDGSITINIPDVGLIMDAGKQITKIRNYLETVINVANGSFDVGGAMGSLKNEACITRLLHQMCTHRLNNPNRLYPRPEVRTACDTAWRMYSKQASTSIFHNCHALMNHLAKSSLAYGHNYYGHDPSKKEIKSANSHNGVYDCDLRKIRVNTTVYVPPDSNPAAAVQQYLNDLHAAYPGGCRGVDNNPITDVEIYSTKECATEEDCKCYGDAPKTQDPATKIKIIHLRGEIETRQRQIRKNNAEKVPLEEKNKKLQEQLNNLVPNPGTTPVVLPGGGVPTPGNDYEKARLEAGIEVNNARIAELDEENSNLQIEIDARVNEIKDLQNNPAFPGGSCAEIQYRYCPANSTPPKLPNDKKDETAGTGAGGYGGGAGQFHRNFFDLLNNILVQMAQNNPCPGQNPFLGLYDHCTGRDTDLPGNPAPGKNPYDDGGLTGVNTGPTIAGDAPCKENDNVRGVIGFWDSGRAEQPCPDSVGKRAECLQGIQRTMKNWARSALIVMKQLGPIENVIGGVVRAIKSINEAMNDINPPTADGCGNVNVANIRDKIAKATAAITVATNDLDNLEALTARFKTEDDE